MNSQYLKICSWLIAPILAVIAYRSVGSFQLTGDAKFLIGENSFILDWSLFWDQALHNYFWSSSGNSIPYWRPFTKLSWFLEYRAFGAWAGGYQLVQLAWFVAAVVGLQKLALVLRIRDDFAVMGAVLLALSPICIDSVCMVMARSDVVCKACMIWSLAFWLQWRSSDHIFHGLAHLIFFALALCSKETAVLLPLLLMIWGLLYGDGTKAQRHRLMYILPAAVIAFCYLGVRKIILANDGFLEQQMIFVLDPLRIYSSLSEYWRNAFPWILHSGIHDVPFAQALSDEFFLKSVFAAVVLLLIVRNARQEKDQMVVALLVWFLLMLLPVILVDNIHVPHGPNQYPLADRWLAHAVAPAILLAMHLGSSANLWLVRYGLHFITCVWVVLMLTRADVMRAEFKDELAMLDNEDRTYYEAIPKAYRNVDDECQYIRRHIARALTQKKYETMFEFLGQEEKVCGGLSPESHINKLVGLIALEKFDEALKVVEILKVRPPEDRRFFGMLAYNFSLVYMHTHQIEEAKKWLKQAKAYGFRNIDPKLEY